MKILLIEDNPDHAELIEDACDKAFSKSSLVETFPTLNDGKAAIETQDYDIGLIDLKLPDSSIISTVSYLTQLKTAFPVVVLTSLNDDNIGLELINKGIQDYLPKNDLNPTLLQRICSYAIERKKRQTALEEKSLDQQNFCSSLSHDFKAPIRNIGIFSKMLQQQLSERVELTADEREMFSLIDDKATIMHELIENLHRYMLAEFSENDLEVVDLNLLMDDIVTLLEGNKNTDFQLNYHKLPAIYGSRSQLFLLFQNSIQNAIKYNNNAPVVDIRSSVSPHATVIAIKDNGIGIDEKFFDLIFRPFQRLHPHHKYSGSGLGLSIVKRIVDRHQGAVSVSSVPGEGSIFTFTFPNQKS